MMREKNSSISSNEHKTVGSRSCIQPFPKLAIFILVSIFFIGFGVSIFILVEVRNVAFLLGFLSLSAIVAGFLLWNLLSSSSNAALLLFLRSRPDSDLRKARHGQIVKITGPVSCGDLSLESSYEKVGQCVYTSTRLYEPQGFGCPALKPRPPCFSERSSTDFYICDRRSGITCLVKAGEGCKIIPLINETTLVNSTGASRVLSPDLIKWLSDRNLSSEPCLMRLEEGYVKQGDSVSVIGMLYKGDDDIAMIVEPPEMISSGCQWQRLLLPLDFDGLLLGPP